MRPSPCGLSHFSVETLPSRIDEIRVEERLEDGSPPREWAGPRPARRTTAAALPDPPALDEPPYARVVVRMVDVTALVGVHDVPPNRWFVGRPVPVRPIPRSSQ